MKNTRVSASHKHVQLILWWILIKIFFKYVLRIRCSTSHWFLFRGMLVVVVVIIIILVINIVRLGTHTHTHPCTFQQVKKAHARRMVEWISQEGERDDEAYFEANSFQFESLVYFDIWSLQVAFCIELWTATPLLVETHVCLESLFLAGVCCLWQCEYRKMSWILTTQFDKTMFIWNSRSEFGIACHIASGIWKSNT